MERRAFRTNYRPLEPVATILSLTARINVTDPNLLQDRNPRQRETDVTSVRRSTSNVRYDILRFLGSAIDNRYESGG